MRKGEKWKIVRLVKNNFPMSGISGPDKAVCKNVKSGKVEKGKKDLHNPVKKNLRHKDIPCIFLDDRFIGQLIVLKIKPQ